MGFIRFYRLKSFLSTVIANFYACFVFALVNQASPKTVTKVAFATTFE